MSSVGQEVLEATDGYEQSHPAPAEAEVSVVLVHRSETVRQGLRRALEHHGLSVVAEAHDAKLAILRVGQCQPTVCLMDWSITGCDFAIEEMRMMVPSVRVAALGASLDSDEVMSAVRAGADGYLLRSTAPDRVSATLLALARGEASLPRAFTAELVEHVRRPRRGSPIRRAGSGVLFPARLLRHYRRRRRADMSRGEAWASARRRMRHYA